MPSTKNGNKSRKGQPGPKQPAARKQKKRNATNNNRPDAEASGGRTAVRRVVGFPQQVRSALTNNEKITEQYLETLSNPWSDRACGVPVVPGGFHLKTDLGRLQMEGQAVSSTANGSCYIGVGCDAWYGVGSSGVPDVAGKYMGNSTQGSPVYDTDSAYVGTSSPIVGSTGTGVNSRVLASKVDANMSLATRYRLVSAAIEVWSDAPAQTAQGSLLVAVTMVPANSAATGGLAVANQLSITNSPDELVTYEEYSLSNWPSDQRVRAFAVPINESSVVMQQLLSAGATGVQYPFILVMGIGMAPLQVIKYRVCFIYEIDAIPSNLLNVYRNPTVSIPASDVANVMPHLRPLTVHKATQGARGIGPAALLSKIGSEDPGRLPALKAAETRGPLGSVLKGGLSWLAGKIPYIGGFAKDLVEELL